MNQVSQPHPRLDLFWDHHGDLTAEHLQHLDRQRRFQHAVVEHGYGVLRYSLNATRLNESILELTEYEAIFQDGTHVVYPGNSQVVTAKLPKGKPGETLIVKLALPKQSVYSLASAQDSAVEPTIHQSRSTRVEQLVTNEDRPEFTTELSFREWTPSIYVHEDKTAPCHTLDLLQIKFDSLGKPQVEPVSAGAILRLGADSQLVLQCIQLCEMIEQADKRTRSLLARFANLPIYNHLILRRQAMARLGQQLASLATENTHPKEVWKALVLGLSELRCLSLLHPIQWSSKYDHDQAGSILLSLIDQIRPFIEFEWVTQSFAVGTGQHTAAFDVAMWNQAQEAYLVSMTEDNQSPVTMDSLLLCSAYELERIRIRRAPGFRLQRTTSASVLPLLGGWQHWQIDRSRPIRA